MSRQNLVCTLRPRWIRCIYRSFQRNGPPLNFITLHYMYFICMSLISAVVLWATSTPPRSLSFVDALFLTVSAISCAGLNTVNLSTLNGFQQGLLFLLIMLGSVILVSAVVVYIRKAAFESRFSHLIHQRKENRDLSHERHSQVQRAAETSLDHDREPEMGGVAIRRHSVSDSVSRDIQLRDLKDATRLHHGNSNAKPASEILTSMGRSQIPECAIDTISIESGDQIDCIVQSRETCATSRPVDQQSERLRHRVFSFSGVGARQDLLNHPKTAHSHDVVFDDSHLDQSSAVDHATGLDNFSKLKIGRNSQFSAMTAVERDKLGGVEYKALKLLGVIVPAYYILFQLFGCIGLGAWVSLNAPEIATNNGLNPWWAGAFNAVSAFNNSGMSLIDANMVAFQWSYYMMITMGMLILVGNTCYPVMLRLIFWTLWKMTPSSDVWKNTKVALRFILDHPRRVYTNLFPSSHTWFLLGTIVTLNAVDWLGFEILNIGNPYVESLPSNLRAIDGLFQATAVRSGGFYVVPIANIAIAVQVLYVLMMYISVYPVTMTMRNSNVYEERSLGIYAGDIPRIAVPSGQQPHSELREQPGLIGIFRRRFTSHRLFAETGTYSRSYFIRQQLRSQLAHDLYWICLAVFFIMIIEGGQFTADPVAFSVFNFLFEVVSGYGTVGISVGLPNQEYSFCGGWHALSKLILCAVMIRGRHRGLPVAIDRAVLLPHEHLADAEEEDARLTTDKMFERSNTDSDNRLNADLRVFRARLSSSKSHHIV